MRNVTSRDRVRAASPTLGIVIVLLILAYLTSPTWMQWAVAGTAFVLGPIAGSSAWQYVHNGLAYALLAAIVWLVWLFVRQARASRAFPVIAARRIRAGLCGACEYSLPQLQSSRESFVVCPECGAAWRPPQPGPGA